MHIPFINISVTLFAIQVLIVDKTNINALVQTIMRSSNSMNKNDWYNGTTPILPHIFIVSAMHMICTCMYNSLDRLRNLCKRVK